MEIGYFGRAALAAGYFAAFGQASLLSQANPQQPIRPKSSLEQRLATKQDSLHSRLIKTIAEDEEELLPTAKAGEHVSEKVGLLVYDDLEKLAERFNRTMGFDGLNVYQVAGNIVVDNRTLSNEGQQSFRRMIFYSDDIALEVEGWTLDYNIGNVKKLKLDISNGRKTVQENTSFNKNFAYIIGMEDYDFSKVYDSIRALQKERSRMRRISPIERVYDRFDGVMVEFKKEFYQDEDWLKYHPVDGIKYEFLQDQLNSIGKGFLAMYGLYAELGISFTRTNNASNTVTASGNAIHVSGYKGWNTVSGELEIIGLAITDRPQASMTTIKTAMSKTLAHPDETEVKPVYPNTK